MASEKDIYDCLLRFKAHKEFLAKGYGSSIRLQRILESCYPRDIDKQRDLFCAVTELAGLGGVIPPSKAAQVFEKWDVTDSLDCRELGELFREVESKASNPLAAFIVNLYCPFDVEGTFPITVEASSAKEALKSVIGTTRTCPKGHTFKVEEFYVVPPAYKSPERIPRPPYEVEPIEGRPVPKWLLGARVLDEDRPFPRGSEPIGSPRLKSISKLVPDKFVTVLYEQDVKSRAIRFLEKYPKTKTIVAGREVTIEYYNPGDIEVLPDVQAKELVKRGIADLAYPEVTFRIEYGRDIYDSLIDEARRLFKTGASEEAVLYLIDYSPGITLQTIADILGYDYTRISRIVAKHLSPTDYQLTGFLEEVEAEGMKKGYYAAKEARLTTELEARTVPRPKPRLVLGPRWRKRITVRPLKDKTDREITQELKRLELGRRQKERPIEYGALTLETWKPTPREREELEQSSKRLREAWRRETIFTYLQTE